MPCRNLPGSVVVTDIVIIGAVAIAFSIPSCLLEALSGPEKPPAGQSLELSELQIGWASRPLPENITSSYSCICDPTCGEFTINNRKKLEAIPNFTLSTTASAVGYAKSAWTVMQLSVAFLTIPELPIKVMWQWHGHADWPEKLERWLDPSLLHAGPQLGAVLAPPSVSVVTSCFVRAKMNEPVSSLGNRVTLPWGNGAQMYLFLGQTLQGLTAAWLGGVIEHPNIFWFLSSWRHFTLTFRADLLGPRLAIIARIIVVYWTLGKMVGDSDKPLTAEEYPWSASHTQAFLWLLRGTRQIVVPITLFFVCLPYAAGLVANLGPGALLGFLGTLISFLAAQCYCCQNTTSHADNSSPLLEGLAPSHHATEGTLVKAGIVIIGCALVGTLPMTKIWESILHTQDTYLCFSSKINLMTLQWQSFQTNDVLQYLAYITIAMVVGLAIMIVVDRYASRSASTTDSGSLPGGMREGFVHTVWVMRSHREASAEQRVTLERSILRAIGTSKGDMMHRHSSQALKSLDTPSTIKLLNAPKEIPDKEGEDCEDIQRGAMVLLKAASIDCRRLLEDGFAARVLLEGFTLAELQAKGLSGAKLQEEGLRFTPQELKAANFTTSEILVSMLPQDGRLALVGKYLKAMQLEAFNPRSWNYCVDFRTQFEAPEREESLRLLAAEIARPGRATRSVLEPTLFQMRHAIQLLGITLQWSDSWNMLDLRFLHGYGDPSLQLFKHYAAIWAIEAAMLFTQPQLPIPHAFLYSRNWMKGVQTQGVEPNSFPIEAYQQVAAFLVNDHHESWWHLSSHPILLFKKSSCSGMIVGLKLFGQPQNIKDPAKFPRALQNTLCLNSVKVMSAEELESQDFSESLISCFKMVDDADVTCTVEGLTLTDAIACKGILLRLLAGVPVLLLQGVQTEPVLSQCGNPREASHVKLLRGEDAGQIHPASWTGEAWKAKDQRFGKSDIQMFKKTGRARALLDMAARTLGLHLLYENINTMTAEQVRDCLARESKLMLVLCGDERSLGGSSCKMLATVLLLGTSDRNDGWNEAHSCIVALIERKKAGPLLFPCGLRDVAVSI